MRPSTMRSDPTENVESFATPLLNISLLYFVASSCVLPSDFLQAFFYMLAFACLCLFFFILTSRPGPYIMHSRQFVRRGSGESGFTGLRMRIYTLRGTIEGFSPFYLVLSPALYSTFS